MFLDVFGGPSLLPQLQLYTAVYCAWSTSANSCSAARNSFPPLRCRLHHEALEQPCVPQLLKRHRVLLEGHIELLVHFGNFSVSSMLRSDPKKSAWPRCRRGPKKIERAKGRGHDRHRLFKWALDTCVSAPIDNMKREKIKERTDKSKNEKKTTRGHDSRIKDRNAKHTPEHRQHATNKNYVQTGPRFFACFSGGMNFNSCLGKYV